MDALRRLLSHPMTRGLRLDDPLTTARRREIIRTKPALQAIYQQWYGWLAAAIPPVAGGGAALELGSGGGFFADVVPGVTTSDVFISPGVQCVLDAQRLPLPDASLRAIAMTNVLHHVPDVRLFFAEAERCVQPGGVVAMIEPWVTPWSWIVYRLLHHEPFEPRTRDWDFPAGGPLSAANDALPWIVFHRDRDLFEREFPQLVIERVEPIMPLQYLLSGGISMRSLIPAAPKVLNAIERCWPMTRMAMFARILLRRR